MERRQTSCKDVFVLNIHLKGYGENWYSCHEFYEGEWFAGKRNGWGRQYYKDGSMYEGEWLDDKRCGDGMLRYRKTRNYALKI